MKANVKAVKLCTILSGVILITLSLITLFSTEYSGVALAYNIAMGLLTSAFITGAVTYVMYIQQKNDFLNSMFKELMLSLNGLYYLQHICLHIANDIQNFSTVQDKDVATLTTQLDSMVKKSDFDITEYIGFINKTKMNILITDYNTFYTSKINLTSSAINFLEKIHMKQATLIDVNELLEFTNTIILLNEKLIFNLCTYYNIDRNYEELIKFAKDTSLSRCSNCTLQQLNQPTNNVK